MTRVSNLVDILAAQNIKIGAQVIAHVYVQEDKFLKKFIPGLLILSFAFSGNVLALDKTSGGALAGAAIGAATGKSVKSTVGGAVVGGGTGAMFKSGDTGKAARKGGAIGAAVGGVAAAATGNSVLKGAAVGAGGGALIGEASH